MYTYLLVITPRSTKHFVCLFTISYYISQWIHHPLRFSSPFALLLLITLIVIDILKAVAVLHHVFFFWKNKGVPYVPNSLSSFVTSWKASLGNISIVDYWQFLYDYYPKAKYIGI